MQQQLRRDNINSSTVKKISKRSDVNLDSISKLTETEASRLRRNESNSGLERSGSQATPITAQPSDLLAFADTEEGAGHRMTGDFGNDPMIVEALTGQPPLGKHSLPFQGNKRTVNPTMAVKQFSRVGPQMSDVEMAFNDHDPMQEISDEIYEEVYENLPGIQNFIEIRQSMVGKQGTDADYDRTRWCCFKRKLKKNDDSIMMFEDRMNIPPSDQYDLDMQYRSLSNPVSVHNSFSQTREPQTPLVLPQGRRSTMHGGLHRSGVNMLENPEQFQGPLMPGHHRNPTSILLQNQLIDPLINNSQLTQQQRRLKAMQNQQLALHQEGGDENLTTDMNRMQSVPNQIGMEFLGSEKDMAQSDPASYPMMQKWRSELPDTQDAQLHRHGTMAYEDRKITSMLLKQGGQIEKSMSTVSFMSRAGAMAVNKMNTKKKMKQIQKWKSKQKENLVKDDWYLYLIKTLKNIHSISQSETPASMQSSTFKKVLEFLKKDTASLKISKFKGEMFFFKYILDHPSEEFENGGSDNLISDVVQFMNQDMLQVERMNKHLEMLAKNTSPIQEMTPRVLKMFVFIEKQLMYFSHPLNHIQNLFITEFVAFYKKKINEKPKFTKKQLLQVIKKDQETLKTQKSLKQSQISSSRDPNMSAGSIRIRELSIASNQPPVQFEPRPSEAMSTDQYLNNLERHNSHNVSASDQSMLLNIPKEILIADKKPRLSGMTKQELQVAEEERGKELLFDEYLLELSQYAFSELKEFISIMYGTCVRFYNSLLDQDDLDQIKEDMIERITTMLFYNDELTDLILYFCQLLTKEDQQTFEARLKEAQDVDLKPSDLNVSKFFNLDKKSNILQEFLAQIKRERKSEEIKLDNAEDAQMIFQNEQYQSKATFGGAGVTSNNGVGITSNLETARFNDGPHISAGDIGDLAYANNKDSVLSHNFKFDPEESKRRSPNLSRNISPSIKRKKEGAESSCNSLHVPVSAQSAANQENSGEVAKKSFQSRNDSIQQKSEESDDRNPRTMSQGSLYNTAGQYQGQGLQGNQGTSKTVHNNQGHTSTIINESQFDDQTLGQSLSAQEDSKREGGLTDFEKRQIANGNQRRQTTDGRRSSSHQEAEITEEVGQFLTVPQTERKPQTNQQPWATLSPNPESLQKQGSSGEVDILDNTQVLNHYNNLLARMEKLPYASAISHLRQIEDRSKFQSPFEMINCVFNLSKLIELSINEFWANVNVTDPDKLIIDGDNILMLFLYIVLKANIKAMPAYMKLMEEFSTPHVHSTSRFGYCVSTMEIAMDRIIQDSLPELMKLQQEQSELERSISFSRDIKQTISRGRGRSESLFVDEGTHNPKTDSMYVKHRREIIKEGKEGSFRKPRKSFAMKEQGTPQKKQTRVWRSRASVYQDDNTLSPNTFERKFTVMFNGRDIHQTPANPFTDPLAPSTPMRNGLQVSDSSRKMTWIRKSSKIKFFSQESESMFYHGNQLAGEQAAEQDQKSQTLLLHQSTYTIHGQAQGAQADARPSIANNTTMMMNQSMGNFLDDTSPSIRDFDIRDRSIYICSSHQIHGSRLQISVKNARSLFQAPESASSTWKPLTTVAWASWLLGDSRISVGYGPVTFAYWANLDGRAFVVAGPRPVWQEPHDGMAFTVSDPPHGKISLILISPSLRISSAITRGIVSASLAASTPRGDDPDSLAWPTMQPVDDEYGEEQKQGGYDNQYENEGYQQQYYEYGHEDDEGADHHYRLAEDGHEHYPADYTTGYKEEQYYETSSPDHLHNPYTQQEAYIEQDLQEPNYLGENIGESPDGYDTTNGPLYLQQ